MSAVFEGYERQYCELSANLSRKCNSVAVILDRGIRLLFTSFMDVFLTVFIIVMYVCVFECVYVI